MSKHKETVLYLICGGLSFILNLVLFYIISKYLPYMIANIITWIIVVAFCFITNKYIVFNNKTDKKLLLQIVIFYISRLFTLGIEEVILFIGIGVLHLNDILIKLIAQSLVIVCNYIISSFLIFKNK